jgi:hypothetical protein
MQLNYILTCTPDLQSIDLFLAQVPGLKRGVSPSFFFPGCELCIKSWGTRPWLLA